METCGSARTFQSVGGPVRRHSFHFPPRSGGSSWSNSPHPHGTGRVPSSQGFWQSLVAFVLWAGGLLTFLSYFILEKAAWRLA